MTFEGAMTRLDEIVKILEEGNVPLEKSIKLFEEGTKLAAQCNSLLENAELKVTELMKGPDGAPVEKEFTDAQL
jgi:exodeoxyribonuclease VII small subunit